MLVAAGHDVTATTRRPDRIASLETLGARAVVVDAFDGAAVQRAVADARPEVLIDELTDLSTGFDTELLRRNARLRIETTPILVAAAEGAGVRRFLAQSGAWLYAPGPTPRTEDDPLRDLLPDDAVLPGVLTLERAVRAASLDGVILRYGYLYGPGTGDDGPTSEPAVHIAAAARATALAVERGRSPIYNVVDDGNVVSNERGKRELGWDPAADRDPLSRT